MAQAPRTFPIDVVSALDEPRLQDQCGEDAGVGHIRLGMLPRTRRWQEVIDLVQGNGSAAAVAGATLDAVEEQFAGAAQDPGLSQTFWLLTQLPEAASGQDLSDALRHLGIAVPAQPTAADLVSGFAEAVDAYLHAEGGRSDLGEMAQMAAVETLASALAARTQNLFGAEHEEVKLGLASLSSESQFGSFARDFFARFSERFLNYYVARETPLHVGRGRRFEDLADKARFNEALRLHCRQASLIVEHFAGRWYGKAKFEGNLDRPRAERFLAYSLKKLRLELNRDRAP